MCSSFWSIVVVSDLKGSCFAVGLILFNVVLVRFGSLYVNYIILERRFLVFFMFLLFSVFEGGLE